MDSSSTPLTDGTSASQEGQSSQMQQQSRLRVKTDPAWAHGVEILVESNGATKKWIRCLHCNEVFKGGGVHRLKRHLAGEKGDVRPCKKVGAEVQHEMQRSIEEFAGKKRKGEEESACVRGSADGDDCVEVSPHEVAEANRASRAKKGKKKSGGAGSSSNRPADRFFLSRGQPGDQQTIKSVLQSKEAVERADLILNKWFLDASIPFNATTSRYYQPAIDAIASLGGGYKGPSMYRMRGPLLTKNVEATKQFAEGYRKAWKESGCTIMADGWTDRKKRTLINFLVYCPKGTIFLKSVDATANSKTGDFLFKLFCDVVRFVGVENVVHFVTDNASNMVLAGKKLEAEFPSIYWSPCAAHCLNLILSDLGKLELVQSAVEHASKITRYLYNHCYPLFLMRKFTNGNEILRPAPTRFATNFVALQSIYKQKDALRTMVISKEWTSAPCAREVKAKRFVDLVLDQQFWKDCASICNFSEPLVRVLRIVDSDERPAMGYMFGSLHCAIEEIEKRFQKKKRAIQQPVLKAIEERWDKHLNKNLHAAGFWFNPVNQYNEELMAKYHTTTSGVIDVIERYAGKDPALRKALTAEMRIFRNAEGDFGRVTAINDRDSMLPDEWWLTYGCSAPNLQKLAIRVLSQTCSASGCERNWSLFEHIHSKKRNRLEHQVMNDMAYVQCNSRLEQKSKILSRNYDPICLEDIAKFDETWILEDDPQLLNMEELDRFRKGLTPDDKEIRNAIAMNDEEQWIDDDYDMDASQENDEANIPTAGDEAIQEEEGEDFGRDHDDGYGDGEHHGTVTDWTFQYR